MGCDLKHEEFSGSVVTEEVSMSMKLNTVTSEAC